MKNELLSNQIERGLNTDEIKEDGDQEKSPELIISDFNSHLTEEMENPQSEDLFISDEEKLPEFVINQESMTIAQVINALPQDINEREVLLDRLKNKSEEGFSDAARINLTLYQDAGPEERKNIRVGMGKDWRNCIAYPRHAEHDIDEQSIGMLDSMGDLMPVPDTESRYTRLAEFLEEAKEMELIDEKEFSKLRNALGPHM